MKLRKHLVIKRVVPSVNPILAMSIEARYREKKATQTAFLSSLSATGADSATRTTFLLSISSIASATRSSFRTTGRRTLNSPFDKKAPKGDERTEVFIYEP